MIRTDDRDKLQNYLSENGIQTLIHYPTPPHKQEAFSEFNKLNFPITEKHSKEVLSLPINKILLNSEVEYLVKILNKY